MSAYDKLMKEMSESKVGRLPTIPKWYSELLEDLTVESDGVYIESKGVKIKLTYDSNRL